MNKSDKEIAANILAIAAEKGWLLPAKASLPEPRLQALMDTYRFICDQIPDAKNPAQSD